MASFKALLFDFDGTLYDTWPAIRDVFCFTYLHFKLGADVSHIHAMASIPHDYQTAFKLAFKTDSPNKEMVEFAEKLYLQTVSDKTKLFPKVRETIDELKRRGFAWGIVTNKRQQFTEAVLSHSGFQDQCKILICAENVEKLKPNPEGLLKACSALEVKPEEVLYVGDSEADVKASQACGMKCAIIFYANAEKTAATKVWGADYTLAEMTDLLDLVD
jgi:phosphoglycolate phosphatase